MRQPEPTPAQPEPKALNRAQGQAVTLHQRIAELSEEHGSLRALAIALDIDVGYLSRLASGEKTNPSAELLAALGLHRHVEFRRSLPSPEPQPKTEKAEARWSIEEAAHLLADRICQRHYVEWVLRKCVDSALAATAQAPDRDDLVLSLRPSEWKSLSPSARAHLRAIVHSGISEMARSQAERAEAVRHAPLTEAPEDTGVPGLQRVPLTEAGRQALTCGSLSPIPAASTDEPLEPRQAFDAWFRKTSNASERELNNWLAFQPGVGYYSDMTGSMWDAWQAGHAYAREAVRAALKAPDDEREAFEKWAVKDGFGVDRDSTGRYESDGCADAWDVWQARAALGREQERADAVARERDRLRRVLEYIAAWGPFPSTDRYWDEEKTRPMSYGAAFGSNGERDYMRNVARAALISQAGETKR